MKIQGEFIGNSNFPVGFLLNLNIPDEENKEEKQKLYSRKVRNVQKVDIQHIIYEVELRLKNKKISHENAIEV